MLRVREAAKRRVAHRADRVPNTDTGAEGRLIGRNHSAARRANTLGQSDPSAPNMTSHRTSVGPLAGELEVQPELTDPIEVVLDPYGRHQFPVPHVKDVDLIDIFEAPAGRG